VPTSRKAPPVVLLALVVGLLLAGCAPGDEGSDAAVPGSSPTAGDPGTATGGQSPPGAVTPTAAPTASGPAVLKPPAGKPSPAAAGLVTLTRTGGIAGRTTVLTVRPDGSTLAKGSDRSLPRRTLSPAGLARLKALLASPALAAEADRAASARSGMPRCSDAFHYTLVWQGRSLAAQACGTISAYPTFRQVLALLAPLLD